MRLTFSVRNSKKMRRCRSQVENSYNRIAKLKQGLFEKIYWRSKADQLEKRLARMNPPTDR